MSDDVIECAVCAEPLTGRWIILNRYAIGTGKSRRLAEGRGNDDEYLWEMTDDEDPEGEEERATGHGMCYPNCLLTFIDATMIETDFEMAHA